MKFYAIRISPQADIDIENLHFYIFENCKSQITAKRYIEGLYYRMKSLSNSAESFPISTMTTMTTRQLRQLLPISTPQSFLPELLS